MADLIPRDAALLFDAYKGLLVLWRMLDKVGLTAGAQRTESIVDAIVAAHPEFPAMTTMRSDPKPIPAIDPAAIREEALRGALAACVAHGQKSKTAMAISAAILAMIGEKK